MKFAGKIAIVTGAAKGIGRGVAQVLAEKGAKVALCDLELSLLEEVVENINVNGGEAFAIKADVSSGFDVTEAVREVVDRYRRLDILINNAGIYLTSPVVEMSEEEWDLVLAVDLKGVFLFSREAARQMVKQKCGRIVNISSIAQVRGGTPGHAHYGAAKAGVGAFTKTLAQELGSFGITVNCVAPGLVEDTEMGKTSKALMGDTYTNTIPLKRLGAVQDVVEAVLFLVSDNSSYITGETLNVNGGSNMA